MEPSTFQATVAATVPVQSLSGVPERVKRKLWLLALAVPLECFAHPAPVVCEKALRGQGKLATVAFGRLETITLKFGVSLPGLPGFAQTRLQP